MDWDNILYLGTRSMPKTEECTFGSTAMRCFRYMDEDAGKVMDSVRTLCGSADTFPGPQPVSIDTSHFETVQRSRYAIARKTDGVRACVVISRTRFDENSTLQTVTMYDRTMRTPYGLFIQHVPKLLYQGTVLDGEVVEQDDGTYTFLIFDCFVLGSMPQRHLCFWDRLRAISRCLEQCYAYAPGADDVRLSVKEFVSLHQAPARGDLLVSPYRSDGFILMPVDEGIVVGHHQRMFKLKTCHSVDFMARDGALWVYNRSARRHVKAGVLASSTTLHIPENSVVECCLESWHKTQSKRVWTPIAVRHDKNRANDSVTMDRTLLNMEQRLTYDHIRALAPS